MRRSLAALALVALALLAPRARADVFTPTCVGAQQCDNVTSFIVANNTTAVPVATHNAQVDGISAFNNSATPAYVKLYVGTSVTCGSGTPFWRGMIPSNSTNGDGFLDTNLNGDYYAGGITACVTTGIADNDTTSPAANTYIVNIRWK